MKAKRIISIILSIVIMLSVIPLGGIIAFAKDTQPEVSNGTTAEIKKTNSLSKILSDAADMSKVSMDSPYYISEMTFDENAATVRYYNEADCWLVVAVYDESTEKMLDSVVSPVYAESVTLSVDMNITLPVHFLAKAFLLDENNAPLCKNFVCRNYTTEYEQFSALTVNDFEESQVVNMDEQEDNNFVVLNDEVINIKGSKTSNVLSSSDAQTNTYILTNIDDSVRNLKAGDTFYLDNGDIENFLAIKIKFISFSDTTATVIAEETESEEIFECIKIDSVASAGQADYSGDTADEGVEYEGEVDYETGESLRKISSINANTNFSISHKFNIKKGVLTAGITLSAKISFSAMISGDYNDISFTIDPSIKVELKAEGKINLIEISLGALDISPVPGLYIGIKPQFVVRLSGTFTVSTELKFTLGVGYNSKDGFINKCKKPTLEANIKAEVTLFVGFDLQPHIAVISSHVAKITLSGEIGAEAKVSMSKTSGTTLHSCSACLDGDLTGKAKISVKLTFGEDTFLETELKATLIDLSWKLGNFYFSSSHNQFGFGSCPWILKEYTVKVTNESGSPVKNAIVKTTSQGDIGSYTNSNGETKKTGSCGKTTLTVEASGYKTVARDIQVSEDTVKFYITLSKKGSSSDITGNKKVGDIVTFGSYPQSKVTDSGTLSALDKISKSWISYGYYSGTGPWDNGQMKPSDYMKYADISYNGSKYRAVTFSKYRPWYTGLTSSSGNTYQYDNGYYTGNIYYFKFEPLKWRILDPEEGLVMCESIIDSQAFNNYLLKSSGGYYGNSSKTFYASDYAQSSIRAWLNDDFYNTAFTNAEKSKIEFSKCENKSTKSSTYDSETTYDKIFLLSYWDAINSSYGFSSKYTYDTARRAQGTDYAKCQGLCVDTETDSSYYGNSDWRLRSPGDSYITWSVSNGGHVYNCLNSDFTSLGVRPALKFNPKSTIIKSSAENIKISSTQKSETENETISFTNSSCIAGNDYILLNAYFCDESTNISNENLLFIDQLTADENGNISASFSPKYRDRRATTLLIGDFGNGTEAVMVGPEPVKTLLSPSKGSTAIIDTDRGFIYGLCEGLTSLEGYAECEFEKIKYSPSSSGFGTGTKVEIKLDEKVLEEYFIVIFGDTTGDGIVDAFDVSNLSSVVNFESEYENEAFYKAADVYDDGYLDAIDLSFMIAAANFEIEIPQTR